MVDLLNSWQTFLSHCVGHVDQLDGEHRHRQSYLKFTMVNL